MGKPTAKNDMGSGGDERGSHERKCKPTGISSKASSNTSLVKKLGESENSSRSKSIGSSATRPPTAARSGSNIRSPIKKEGLGQPANRVSSRLSVISKEAKKPIEIVKIKSQTHKMKQESESKQKVSNLQSENQDLSGLTETVKPGKESNHKVEQSSGESKNGLNGAQASSEASTTENGAKANGKSEQNGDSTATTAECDEDFKLRLEAEDPSNQIVNKEATGEANKNEEVSGELKVLTDGTEESQTDADSNSVVVESTTSELSEATESTAPSEVKDDESENANNEGGAYDSSKLQKNCSITLTNCLEDPQFADLIIKKSLERCNNTRKNPISKETNDSQQSQSQNYAKNSISDIRKVSGRRSLSRLRNEPGSINTSYDSERTIFQSPLRPPQNLSNGRILDEERKRKLTLEARNDAKKLRDGETAAPVQKNLTTEQITNEKPVRRNVWCPIM